MQIMAIKYFKTLLLPNAGDRTKHRLSTGQAMFGNSTIALLSVLSSKYYIVWSASIKLYF